MHGALFFLVAGVALHAGTPVGLPSVSLYFEPAPGGGFLARSGAITLQLDQQGVRMGGAIMRLAGARLRPAIEPLEPRAGRSSYFLGADPSQWRTSVPHYGRVRYRELYPGVDLVFHGAQGDLQYDFHVAPGANPSAIRLQFDGARKTIIDASGDLVVDTSAGEVRHKRPRVFQDHRELAGRFVSRRGEIGFAVEGYDTSRPLLIDPRLTFSNGFGGAPRTEILDVLRVGPKLYAVGTGTSTGSAPQNPIGPRGGEDVMVFVIDVPSGKHEITVNFGGSGDDSGRAIAVGDDGSIHIAGSTTSSNLPVVNPFQSSIGSPNIPDGFLARFNPAGTALSYSTYIGGAGQDFVKSMVLDRQNRITLVGATGSDNFPVRNAIQGTRRGGNCRISGATVPCFDAFVSRFMAGGAQLDFSTYLGGTNATTTSSGDNLGGQTVPGGLAVGSDFRTVITGFTYTPAYPTTPGVVTRTKDLRDMPAAFVSKLNPAGSSLEFSTFIGGQGVTSRATGVALGNDNTIFVTGSTPSAGFPVMGAIQPQPGGGEDIFVFRLNPTGTLNLFSTFYGGSGEDVPIDIFNAGANLVVTGTTRSGDFPVVDPVQANPGGGRDAFVWSFDSARTIFSSYLGGVRDDISNAIDAASDGTIILGGATNSPDFSFTNEFQPNPASNIINGFTAIITPGVSDPKTLTLAHAANYSRRAVAPNSFVSAIAPDLADETIVAQGLVPSLGGRSIRVTDSAGNTSTGMISFVSDQQINFLLDSVALGRAKVEVIGEDDAVIAAGKVIVENVAPGLFSANGSGQGVAAATATIVRSDDSVVNQLTFRFDEAQGRLVPEPILLLPGDKAAVVTLFGTGFSKASKEDVDAAIGLRPVEVVYAGPQGQFPGLDQLNLNLIPQLTGRMEIPTDIEIGGIKLNTLTIFVGGVRPPPVLQFIAPDRGETGSTISNFTLMGDNLDTVNQIVFDPDSINVTNLLAGLNSVTAQVSIPANAAATPRMVSVNGSAGRSNSLSFSIVPSTRPNILSFDPVSGRIGQMVDFTIDGTNLLNPTGVSFSPSTGVTAQVLSSTANRITGRANISLAAPINQRQVLVNTAAGASNMMPFTILGPTSNTPVIADVILNVTGSAAAYTTTGSLNFADADGNILSTGVSATSAKIRFQASAPGGSCTREVTGSFMGTTSRQNGMLSFTIPGVNANLSFTNAAVRVSLLDAAGSESNAIVVQLPRWFC